MRTTVGIVSPGAMGSGLGRAWAACGARVVATVDGRSERTQKLADGLELLPTLADVVRASDVVVSICPPAAAAGVAAEVLKVGSKPATFADLNAISPIQCRQIDQLMTAAGWDFIDGSISGGPPSPKFSRPTLLYLSGTTDLLAGMCTPELTPIILGAEAGVASAVKMCTASVYKGTKALWMQALLTAQYFGVEDVVFNDLAADFPSQARHAAIDLALAASKSHRFVAEMENIAKTQASAGEGAELFTAIADVFERVSGTPLAQLSPEEALAITDLTEVLRRLKR